MSIFPETLYESDEFGTSLICSKEQYQEEIRNAIDSGFVENFNPEPKEWNLIDSKKGVYQQVRYWTSDAKHHSEVIIAVMTWNPHQGSYAAAVE